MGKYKWQWNKVNAGHLIEFIYNGSLRVVIVLLSPRDSGAQDKTLLHGLEIVKKGNGIEGLKARMKSMLHKMGGVQLVATDKRYGRFYKINMGWASGDRKKPKAVYGTMKGMIKSQDIYRTYSWNKCKKKPVWLDNDELNDINIPTQILTEAGVIPDEKFMGEKPKPKTFRQKQKRPKYRPGTYWKRPGGKWAAKSMDNKLKVFNEEVEAEAWSMTTDRAYKKKQLKDAEKRSKK